MLVTIESIHEEKAGAGTRVSHHAVGTLAPTSVQNDLGAYRTFPYM
jgi:hypothetical protein